MGSSTSFWSCPSYSSSSFKRGKCMNHHVCPFWHKQDRINCIHNGRLYVFTFGIIHDLFNWLYFLFIYIFFKNTTSYKFANPVNVWPYLVKYLILSRSISFFLWYSAAPGVHIELQHASLQTGILKASKVGSSVEWIRLINSGTNPHL